MKKYWFWDEKIYWFCDEEILKSKFREIFTLRGTFINGKMYRALREWFVRFAKNAFASTWERVICWIYRKCIYILDHHCFFLGRCVGRFGSFKSFCFCNFIRFYDFMQYQLCFSSIQIVCFMIIISLNWYWVTSPYHILHHNAIINASCFVMKNNIAHKDNLKQVIRDNPPLRVNYSG